MAEPIDEYFTATIAAMSEHASADRSALTGPNWLALFDAQLGSRHLDLAARWLRSHGKGFYTIGSSGHEGNVASRRRAAAHRSRAAALPLGWLLPGPRPAGVGTATRCATCCSGWSRPPRSRSPAAGTRCSAATICTSFRRPRRSPPTFRERSGVAFSIARARKLRRRVAVARRRAWRCAVSVTRRPTTRPRVGAINTAVHSAYQGVPMPLLFVCEDNGIGISTKTPRGWIARDLRRPGRARVLRGRRLRPAGGLRRRRGGGTWVRDHRRPAFLHLQTVRLMGHAGSDYEPAYRKPGEIQRRLRAGSGAVHRETADRRGMLTPAEVLDRYEAKRAEVLRTGRGGQRTRPARQRAQR